jgi:hypothetical protein
VVPEASAVNPMPMTLTVVIPVPITAPLEEIPMVAVSPVAIPVRLEPSPK